MVRLSKQKERRHVSFRRNRGPTKKTGPRKDNLPLGFKEHKNAVEGDTAKTVFIAKL